jgi:hypothetical protein
VPARGTSDHDLVETEERTNADLRCDEGGCDPNPENQAMLWSAIAGDLSRGVELGVSR